MSDETTVGIDLGTTRTTVATVTDSDAEVIENTRGNRTTPSVVRYKQEDGETVAVVGENALDAAEMYPEETVQRIKRKMGDSDHVERIHGEEYTPPEVSANILEHVRSAAEERLGESVDSAVITVPAYFGDRERQNTRDAARLIDLEVERILDEPTAACIAYGLGEGEGTDGTEHVFVYDLGGGTFDATLVEVTYVDEFNTIEAVHTEGFRGLGGEDWDDAVVDWIADTVDAAVNEDVRSDEEAMKRIRKKAREAKETLSEQGSTTIRIPYVTAGYNFEEELTRERFDEMTADLLDQTFEACDNIFEDSEFAVGDVDKVLLCGGSTRMPQVEDAVADYFGQEPSKEINPDEAVARGAAVAAAIDYDPDVAKELLPGESGILNYASNAPKALGVETAQGYSVLIESDTSLPAVGEDEFTTVEDNQPRADIKVYEGPGPIGEEGTNFLGKATLTGIREAPAGVPDIKVEYTLDEDGRLSVYGTDLDTGAEVEAEIEGAFRRDDDEIDEMQRALPTTDTDELPG
jgi:molecular chaperone DnaK